MHPQRRTRLSKFLSLILRHRPEEVGLVLDPQGRVPLEDLVRALRAHGWEDLGMEDVLEVTRLDARRFQLEDGMIRARYGHSVTLQQPGPAVRPPEWLYYAVPAAEQDRVRADGLRPGQRRYVHLCLTPQEAARQLQRHGTAGVVLPVLARRAHAAGIPFYQATDHLYLAPRVPPEFLCLHAPARSRQPPVSPAEPT